MKYDLREEDVALVFMLMCPEYVIPLAMDYGWGCAVTGAPAAYKKIRGMVRNYIRYVRWRDSVTTADLRIALNLRALGWIPYNYSHVEPLEQNDWRDTAIAFWGEGGGLIPGYLPLENLDCTQEQLDNATIIAVSNVLDQHPEVNRAYLQGRVWQRLTPEVMIHKEVKGNVRSMVLNASYKSGTWVNIKKRKALRIMFEDHRNPSRLTKLAPKLLQAWAGCGFITSSAGAMISLVGNSDVEMGHAALVPANGIPLAISAGKVINNKAWIGLNVDHKVIDGGAAGMMYSFLKREIPRVIEYEKQNEDTSSRR